MFDEDMNHELTRPLDVHKWSEHKEVNKFVNSIYNDYFKFHNPTLVTKCSPAEL